jgi:hypothetical protein
MPKPKEEKPKKEEKPVDYLPEDEEKPFLEWMAKQVTEHPVVKNYHGTWKELIAWGDKGDQFSEWNNDSRVMKPVVLVKRKKKIVINLMKPLGEAIEGKVNMAYKLVGSPNSSEISDVRASKITTKLLDHNDYVNDTDYLNEDLKYDLTRTGNAFKKWTFDFGEHGYIPILDDNDKVSGNTSQKGEVAGAVPSIFNCRPDPSAKTRKQMRYFTEIMEVTEGEILNKFKVTEEELKAEASEDEADKGKGMNEPSQDKDKDEKTHIVRFYWERKDTKPAPGQTKKYKEGRYIISTGNHVLYKDKNPALGEIPYFHYGWKRYANSMWHTGPYEHVQPIQRDFNRTVSIISEHMEGWRAKMVVPEGSIVNKGAFTTDSFELLEVDTTRGEPHPLRMPELSAQIFAHRDFLREMIMWVANVHEVSFSQLPKYASRAPASLFSMMLEQENLKIDPMIKRMNHTIVEEGKFRLRLMDKYYKQPRLVKVVGEGDQASIEYFKGSEIDGNYDVRVEIGISLHQSRTIKQRLLLELKQAGAPISWNKIIKLLDEGDVSKVLRSDIADENRAVRENQSFRNNTYDKPREEGGVFVYLHDNHELHLEFHSDESKTEDAQKWDKKKWDDFQQHINAHFMLMNMLKQVGVQQGQQQPGQQPTQAQPGGGAPPCAPPRAQAPGEAPTGEVQVEREVTA